MGFMRDCFSPVGPNYPRPLRALRQGPRTIPHVPAVPSGKFSLPSGLLHPRARIGLPRAAPDVGPRNRETGKQGRVGRANFFARRRRVRDRSTYSPQILISSTSYPPYHHTRRAIQPAASSYDTPSAVAWCLGPCRTQCRCLPTLQDATSHQTRQPCPWIPAPPPPDPSTAAPIHQRRCASPCHALHRRL